jgi:uncharacterized membrane protein
MRVSILLSNVLSLILLALLPLLFTRIMEASLEKLHIGPRAATALVIAIILGGFVNIPVGRIARDEDVRSNPLAVWGFDDRFPRLQSQRRETIIAVNVGGCLMPVAIALYELKMLAAAGMTALLPVMAACLVNIVVCYLAARPISGLGIGMPAFIAPVAATLSAMVLAPDAAPPVAFIAGVMGPLVGADLAHLKEITRVATTGVGSIGGAGTFDGIVLSGILAAYLA